MTIVSVALRPGFSMDLACPSATVLERLYEKLDKGPHQLRRTRAFNGQGQPVARDNDHFVLTVDEASQRVWSPWLRVEVTPKGDGAHLAARFSPHPSVWTLFAFTYLGLTVILLLSLCFAAALVMTGASPWALFVSGGTAVVMLAMWWASQIGQRWSRDQMLALRDELEQAVTECTGSVPHIVHD